MNPNLPSLSWSDASIRNWLRANLQRVGVKAITSIRKNPRTGVYTAYTSMPFNGGCIIDYRAGHQTASIYRVLDNGKHEKVGMVDL